MLPAASMLSAAEAIAIKKAATAWSCFAPRLSPRHSALPRLELRRMRPVVTDCPVGLRWLPTEANALVQETNPRQRRRARIPRLRWPRHRKPRPRRNRPSRSRRPGEPAPWTPPPTGRRNVNFVPRLESRFMPIRPVSLEARRLINRLPMAGSSAQEGIRPQWRKAVCRVPSCWRIARTVWVGATLKRGENSGVSAR